MTVKPYIGDIVIYARSHGGEVVPAIVSRTVASTVAQQNRFAAVLPALTSDTHVDLTVFGPRQTYKKRDVPLTTLDEFDELAKDIEPGTWAPPQKDAVAALAVPEEVTTS